jgi:hypothetical protein
MPVLMWVKTMLKSCQKYCYSYLTFLEDMVIKTVAYTTMQVKEDV